MTNTDLTRRLRVPVRFVDGLWECAFGGAVPVKNGTEAELVVPRTSISDKTFLKTMERKGRHKVLDEGTPLLVCLTIKSDKAAPHSSGRAQTRRHARARQSERRYGRGSSTVKLLKPIIILSHHFTCGTFGPKQN